MINYICIDNCGTFSEAYKFLENALMGQPQKKMSDATKEFLSKEIEVSRRQQHQLSKTVKKKGNPNANSCS